MWAAWIAAALAASAANYALSGRSMLLLLPPWVLSWAQRREAQGLARESVYRAAFTAMAALSLALGYVDWRYAESQRVVAEEIARPFVRQGRRVWYTGHWGLQHYMDAAGAHPLERDGAEWSAVSRGDIVVIPSVNAWIVAPEKNVLGRQSNLTIDSGVPLRLMRFDAAQAGFYSSGWGFLPYTISREPIERFTLFERVR